ncbi:MAG TPA: phage holin family protein [Burkholderiaceae bacterium]
MEHKPAGKSDTHLIAGLIGVVKNMIGLLLSRIELAALELAEVRTTLLKLSVAAAIGLLAAWFALAYWSVLLVYLAWNTLGWVILLLVAVGFTVVAVAVLLYVRAIVMREKLSLLATMNELRNDRDALL